MMASSSRSILAVIDIKLFQMAILKRELEEALSASRGLQGLKEECAVLKQELKLLKDER
jgi:hypothetical protein